MLMCKYKKSFRIYRKVIFTPYIYGMSAERVKVFLKPTYIPSTGNWPGARFSGEGFLNILQDFDDRVRNYSP